MLNYISRKIKDFWFIFMRPLKKLIDKDLLYIKSENGDLSLFALAVPLFISLISVHLIGMLQTVLASRYAGGFFVIPISVSNTLITVVTAILGMVSSGTNILMSISLGKDRKEDCKKLFGTAIISTCFLSIIVLAVAFIFAEPLLKLMASNGTEFTEYIPATVEYFRIRLLAVFFSVIYTVINGVLQCYGHTKIGLLCGVVINALTVSVTAIIVYLVNLPAKYGAAAFGWSSVFATAVGLALSALFTTKKKIGVNFKISARHIKEIFSIGAPASVSSIFYTVSQTVTTSICLNLTANAFLAKNYVTQIVYFVYVFGFAIGQAAAIMVGRLCGMNLLDKADKFTRQNYKIVISINTTLSLILFALGRPLISLFFGASEGVLEFVTVVMLIDVIVELGRGMNHIGQFSLNATGDVKFTTIVSVVSCWACSVGLAYLLGITFNMGLYGIWTAFAVDELFRGTLYFLRFKKQGWKNKFKI